ncbi:MAG: hypothetical protein ACOYN3_04685 [Acidimicrobiia bacterium]
MSSGRPIQFSRREFLGLSLGAVVLAACGSSGGSSANPTSNRLIPLRLSSELYATTDRQRFAFGLWQNGKAASGPAADIGFKGPGGDLIMPVAAQLRSEGLPANRGVYTAHPVLDTPGTWSAFIRVNNQTLELPFTVAADARTPKVGSAAPRAASPTLTNPLGVDPICTADPPCPLHTTSLDTVIGTRPVAVLFATPARCQSQYCGPVLEEVLAVRGPYADAIDFVHVEIYENNQSTRTAPTVQAWGLDSEPWLFTIRADGTVLGRLDGAFDRSEIRAELDRLVAPGNTSQR